MQPCLFARCNFAERKIFLLPSVEQFCAGVRCFCQPSMFNSCFLFFGKIIHGENFMKIMMGSQVWPWSSMKLEIPCSEVVCLWSSCLQLFTGAYHWPNRHSIVLLRLWIRFRGYVLSNEQFFCIQNFVISKVEIGNHFLVEKDLAGHDC